MEPARDRPTRRHTGILRALLSGLSEEQAASKPSPDRFSVAEVLRHLSHVEGTDSARGRIE